MPLDRYVNIVTAMINNGRFSHIGHGVLRLEGGSTTGTLPKVVVPACELCVPYHVGNRTLTFHGSASTVRQLLLPLFQDWTFATLASLPPVSQVGEPQPPLAPTLFAPPLPPISSPCTQPPLCQGTPQPVPLPPQPQPSGPCTPHRCQGCQELISLVRRLAFQLEALLLLHLLHALAPLSPTPRASTPMRAHPGELCWPSPFAFSPYRSASTSLS